MLACEIIYIFISIFATTHSYSERNISEIYFIHVIIIHSTFHE